ncbi:MAG: ABC transporter permease, partial [Bacteroidota bacterium]
MKYDIRTSFRYMRREAGYTAINILGLALGLAISLMIIQYVRYEFSYESYNPNADRMVRVTMDYMDGETLIEQDCETYPPLGPRIKDEF